MSCKVAQVAAREFLSHYVLIAASLAVFFVSVPVGKCLLAAILIYSVATAIFTKPGQDVFSVPEEEINDSPAATGKDILAALGVSNFNTLPFITNNISFFTLTDPSGHQKDLIQAMGKHALMRGVEACGGPCIFFRFSKNGKECVEILYRSVTQIHAGKKQKIKLSEVQLDLGNWYFSTSFLAEKPRQILKSDLVLLNKSF
jgi:hypothetical protein